VQAAAAQALAAIPSGARANQVIDKLLPLLGPSNTAVQSAAAQALAAIPSGDRANQVIDKLLPLLGSSNGDVQAAAAQALAAIGRGGRADEVIGKLLPLLESSNGDVQAAAQALAAIPSGARANQVIDKLLPLLESSNTEVQSAAAQALAAIPSGDRANQVIDKLLPLLESSERRLQEAAVQALAKAGPASASTAVAVLGDIHDAARAATQRVRSIAHIVTGADAKHEDSEILLSWLGRPSVLPLASIANNPIAAHAVIETFDRHWLPIAANEGLQQEAEGRVRDIVHEACLAPPETHGQWLAAAWTWIRDLPLQGPVRRCWTPEQRSTLEHLVAGFQDGGNADALKAHLAREKAAPVLQWLTWSLAGWALFWAAFLFVFPWSRTIQAIFFWNPKVRDMLSLWFVPLLLLLVRPLRRRLLAPFRDDLVAAARPADLPRLAFFGQSRARVGDNPPVALETVLKGLHGVVVLRGDAGLGKTSALRWVAARSRRPVAFLLARDCAAGVDVMIAHLIHDIQETAFVRSMVYAGALMVIVDGLNEVSADTREKIGAFARDMSKGNVLIGTQPIEWKEPPGAQTVDLLPLDRQEAERFLLSRPVGADTAQKVHGGAYDDAVRAFLRRALDEAPSEVDRQAAVLVLSNPFDLTFGADLLAQGSKPSATALIDEAFRLADEGAPGEPGYCAVAGQPFPLTRFGGLAVAMRLEDRNWFKLDEFAPELPCLLKRRLLVQRAVGGATGVEERIQFRHDRVWDFFIAAAFLDDRDLWAEHLADPRFRGAYLRIAETWPPEHAARVRDRLVVTAAKRGDHTTSDEFINRLESRLKSLETPGNESHVAAQ
jgi:HEAT repeat protein